MPAALSSIVRSVLLWLLIILGESLHGALRRLLLSEAAIESWRQVSVGLGVVIVFAITWFCLPFLRLRSTGSALTTGAIWVALTVVFEVALGRLTGVSWPQILAEYDLTRGGLMPLGLLAMGMAPWLVQKLRTAPPEQRDAS